jgi:hypothetical protein
MSPKFEEDVKKYKLEIHINDESETGLQSIFYLVISVTTSKVSDD